MKFIALKTGERAQWSASFLITLKTGDVLELTIYAGSLSEVQPVVAHAETGEKPPAVPNLKLGDPAGFVFSNNIAHRHLEKGQLAMAGAKLKDYFAAKAKERQSVAGKERHGQLVESLPPAESGKARDQAAQKGPFATRVLPVCHSWCDGNCHAEARPC